MHEKTAFIKKACESMCQVFSLLFYCQACEHYLASEHLHENKVLNSPQHLSSLYI